MRNLILLIGVSMLLFTACSEQAQKNTATIKGTVSKETKSLKFKWIKEHTADIGPQSVVAQIDSLGAFEVEIPVQQLSSGLMDIDGKSYDVAFAPNDKIELKIVNDTIEFSGTGASKNNFLYALSKNNKCSRMEIAMSWYTEEHEFAEFFDMINEYMDARKQEFEKFTASHTLSQEFINYFEIESKISYIDLYTQASIAYTQKNRLPIDSAIVPKELEKHFSIKSVQNDEHLACPYYFDVIRELIRSNTKKLLSTNDALNRDSVILSFLMDSLSGSTREHLLLERIYYNFSIYDKYDTALVSSFNKIKTDKNCIAVFDKTLERFNKKQEMLGASLSSDILKTKLRDTANNQKTLADVLKKHEGKIVYLDIWSLGCGPCRIAMPLSKKLKDKLKDQPIEFVYFTVDGYSDNLWDEVFTVSLGKENHYRFENSFDSKLLKALDIIAVPTYFIFDKTGKLVSYKAERPYNNQGQENTELEKQLIELSTNI